MTPVIKRSLAYLGSDGKAGGSGGTEFAPDPNTYIDAADPGSKLVRYQVPQPAAGSEWALTLPTNGAFATRDGDITCPAGIWARVLFGFLTLNTSASAGVRRTGLRIKDADGATVLLHHLSQAQINPGIAAKIVLWRSGAPIYSSGSATSSDGVHYNPIAIPGAMILTPGQAVGSYSGGLLLANDQYSAAEVLLQIWTAEPVYDGLGPAT